MSARTLERALAAGLGLVLLVPSGCATTSARGRVPKPSSATPAAASEEESRPEGSKPETPRPGDAGRRGASPRLALETDVTYVASLVHWIDSLAGTSGGKTIPGYRRLWSSRFGGPSPDDTAALGEFVRARTSREADRTSREQPHADGDPHPNWANRLPFLALEAKDIEGFLASTRPYLTPEQEAGLEASLTHFRPGFDSFWRDSGYLSRFDARFRAYLERGPLPAYLGEVARFFDVTPAVHPAPILSFVLLPIDGVGTHAQAFGRRLLIEIRPIDLPETQVSVVSHEESHYLFEMIPGDRLEALRERARSAGPGGGTAFGLLQEGLPTALGQGLATWRLAPREFGFDYPWYHTEQINHFAKMIFPIVKEEMESGRTIDGPFIERIVAAYQRSGGIEPGSGSLRPAGAADRFARRR